MSGRLLRLPLLLACVFVLALTGCNRSGQVAFSSIVGAAASGNGTPYDGMQAQYFSYDKNHPCQDLDASGSPMPNQIMFATFVASQIQSAVLARTQCLQVVPASKITVSSLSLLDGNILYQGAVFSLAPAQASSPSLAAIPTVSSLTDDFGVVWTINGGVAYRNGTIDPTTNSIVSLLFYEGTIYQETSHLDTNGNSLWWYWANNTWYQAPKPD